MAGSGSIQCRSSVLARIVDEWARAFELLGWPERHVRLLQFNLILI